MKNIANFVLGLALCAACLFVIRIAFARPSLAYVEQAFGLVPGRTMQRTLPDGEIIMVEYRRIEPLGGGEYAIVVRLDR